MPQQYTAETCNSLYVMNKNIIVLVSVYHNPNGISCLFSLHNKYSHTRIICVVHRKRWMMHNWVKRGAKICLYATGSKGWKMLNIRRQAGISSSMFSSPQYSFPLPEKKNTKTLNGDSKTIYLWTIYTMICLGEQNIKWEYFRIHTYIVT